jgi:arylsulfatase
MSRTPNILLVLVDDMGYSDIGCYGGEIETPTLDRLAANGVRYARFYNCAQCSPTRASLMTGLYPHQAGMGEMNARGPGDPFYHYLGSPQYLGFKQEGIVTMPEALRAAGYQTLMSGKWHLGDTPDNWPSVRGFDRTFSLIIGASEHFSGRPAWKNEGPIAPFILDGKRLESLPEGFYSTDTFTDYAMRFIRESKAGKPWFCYLSYTAPHWPLQAHEKDAAKYDAVYRQHPETLRRRRFQRMKALGLVPEAAALPPLDPDITADGIEKNREWRDRSMRHYAGMIDCVDRNLGRLVALLEERGELTNTLILFLSDNGADTVRGPLWGQLDNAPFRRFKVWVHDGGICTPLIAHWPAAISPEQRGRIIGGYGHVIDLQPTCLDAAGAAQPEAYNGRPVAPLEGISLLPSMRGVAELLIRNRFSGGADTRPPRPA